MIFSVAYLLARRPLGCLMVLARREVSKDAELLILRPENAVLRRRIVRVRYTSLAAWQPRLEVDVWSADLNIHTSPHEGGRLLLPPTARSCRYEFRSLAGAYLSRCPADAVERSWVYRLVGGYRVLGGGVRRASSAARAGDTAAIASATLGNGGTGFIPTSLRAACLCWITGCCPLSFRRTWDVS